MMEPFPHEPLIAIITESGSENDNNNEDDG
jgi:hypothetical protein